jgi:hypothetical protein
MIAISLRRGGAKPGEAGAAKPGEAGAGDVVDDLMDTQLVVRLVRESAPPA